MDYDIFFSISQTPVLGVQPDEATMFRNFFDQVEAADELGYDTAWIAEAHLSTEVQKQHERPVVPHWQGEIGLNTDIFQMAHQVFRRTRNLNVGSAVAFFNQTYRSKKLLAAWAEAMQYGTNSKAPDDQVLDKLMKEGGWLKRVSVGWLPAAYLRLMPSFYRGVDPVIDHDRGTKPGVAGHSSVKPLLPPVMWTEKVDAAELRKDQEASGRTFGTAVPAGSR